MGGGGGGDSEQTIRHPKYMEEAHKQLLNDGGDDDLILSIFDAINMAFNLSPYDSHTPPAVNDAYFGDGYVIESFPSQYDMFGRFMGGLDVCDLWAYIYENVVHAPEIERSVSAHAELLDDDIQAKVLPRFNAGMRDINSVMASSFIIGKAIIENARVKSVNNFQAEIRLKAIGLSGEIWKKHLDWNSSVIAQYNQLATQYYNTREAVDRTAFEYETKDILWNANLFEYGRAMVGALSGAGSTKTDGNEPSKAQGVIGGAMAGASMGAMTGNPMMALGGGVIGGLAALF